MTDILHYPLTVTALLLFAHFLLRRLRRAPGLPLPPGPKGYPIIGNLFEIGQQEQPRHVHAQLIGNTRPGALLRKEVRRAAGTKIDNIFWKALPPHAVRAVSPYSPLRLRDLTMCYAFRMKYDEYFSNAQYGPVWRRRRRVFHQYANATVSHRYHHIISGEVVQLLQDLADSPGRFRRHIQHYVNRVIFRTFYGVKIADENDPYILLGKWTMDGFIQCSVPGTFLIDMIPALKHVPDWMPGTGWKKVATHYKEIAHKARQDPWNYIMEKMKEGVAEPSVASRMIEGLSPVGSPTRAQEEDDARDALGVGYIAGSDTTLAAAMTFVLLMAKYPEVQKKAQAELDRVVGFGQIPTFEDRPKLVYIQAVIREVLRWISMLRLGVPHATTEDDIYDGYLIPRGTIVVPNIWHMANDPASYNNPSEFMPERHIKGGVIDKDTLDPLSLVFGFGRRICPGRHMSLDVLFQLFSATLSLFDFEPPKDQAGNSTLKASFATSGAIVSPHPYDCVIKPRSFRHGEFVRSLDPSSKD
ncbi:hypothetical protein NMY22_g4463 [Coprinellus aureogranulatus]|nr:hypothetical protein NMY22_g4463 [Coprinellus aureogranulatus]